MFPFLMWVGMIADIKPGPAVKSARTHTADVIGRQILADLVPFICTHPELVSTGTKGNSDSVANSPCIDFLIGAPSGLNSKIRARSASAALSETLERDPIETYIFLPSGAKTISRVQWPPLRRCAAPPDKRAPSFSAGPRTLRSPSRYGYRIIPSVLATYKNCGSFPGG